MLVKEYYLECLLTEDSTLAHCIYHLLSEQKVSLQDEFSQSDLHKADFKVVTEMIENNVLGIRRLNIYSLKMNQQDFVFIFARSRQEAIQFCAKTYQQTPINCHEYLLDFEIVRGNETITFRDMKKEFEEFPAVVGVYSRDAGPLSQRGRDKGTGTLSQH